MFMVQLSEQGSIYVNMVYIGISTFEFTMYLKFFRHTILSFTIVIDNQYWCVGCNSDCQQKKM